MLEKSCGWWPIWYLLFFCHGGAEGQLQWDVKEKVTDYGQNVTLFCPVENCCSELAGWSVGQESIFIDLKKYSNDSSKKYGGTYNKDGFGVVIRNLSEADLNVTHRCDYGFNRSTPKYLLHDDVFIESTDVPDKDKDKEYNTVTENNTVADNDTVAIVLSIVGSIVVAGIVVGAIIIVCIIKKKRPPRTDSPPKPEELPLIEVVGSPTVEVHQSSYSVTTGKKVTLVSTVSSSRRINDVYWQKNIDGSITFMNFDTITRKYSGSTTTTPSLTIFNASSSDAGTYTCWAINDVGRGRSTITTLSVTENPPTVKVHQPSHSVTTGDDVTLVCTVNSSLDVSCVEWQRNTDDSIKCITSDTNIEKYNCGNVDTPSLTILNASSSDAGTYTCCARSSGGKGHSTPTTLSVTENDDLEEKHLRKHLYKQIEDMENSCSGEMKMPQKLKDDTTFLSLLLEKYKDNIRYHRTEFFSASLLELVMKYRPTTEIINEVLNNMSTILKSQISSVKIIWCHRAVQVARTEAHKNNRIDVKTILGRFIKEQHFYYSSQGNWDTDL